MAKRALNGQGTVYRERSSWLGRVEVDGTLVEVREPTRARCVAAISAATATAKTSKVLDVSKAGRDRWVGQAYDVQGKRRKVTGSTREEATLKLEDLQGHRKKGKAVPDALMTFEALVERRERSQAGAARSQATREHDAWAVGVLVKEFGGVKLKSLTVARCEEGMMQIAGGEYSRVPLSKRSARRILAMLRRILDYAERLELVVRNPAARLDAGVFGESRTASTISLTSHEAATLFEAVEGEWIGNYVRLGLFIGARPSELAGLQWDAVDLDAGRIEIRRSRRKVAGGYAIVDVLKTAGSLRVLQLPSGAVEVLQAQRTAVLAAQMKAAQWPHPELVFPTKDGTLLDPPNVRRDLKRICRNAGLPEVGPNALRHSVASLLAESGESPARVAHLLGHSTPATAMKHYTHRTAEASDAATGMAVHIGGSPPATPPAAGLGLPRESS